MASSQPKQYCPRFQALKLIVPVLLLAACLCGIALGQTNDLTVVVLINSSNTTGYNVSPTSPGEYQRYPERYLEHLQIPYRIVDVSTSAVQDMTSAQLIIAAHRGLSLSPDWQQAIITAVAGGTGFVNLDSDPGIGTNAHIQAIFGATGSLTGAQTGYAIDIPSNVMPDGATPHYIAGMQIRFPSTPPGDLIYSFHYDDSGNRNGVVPTILQGATGTVIAKLDTNDPLILATTYQAGRAVNFGSYDYMRPDRFGFMMGVDDLFWRSLVWAARKPFIVRGYPRFFAVQMDDLDGGFMSRIPDLYNPSFTGNVLPDGTGGPWKPTLNFGMNDILGDARAPYISAVQAGLIEMSPHAIELENAGGDFYWDMTIPNSDAQWLTSLNAMLAFKNGQGGSDSIPSFSRSMVPHYGDLSNNAGYDMWNSLGQRYITTEQSPGTYYFVSCKTGSQRMMLRPYRIYELPPSGCDPAEEYPIYYADDLTVGSRAGLPSQTFFAFATWPPLSEIWPQYSGWTEDQSLQSFEHDTWRFWSGLAPFEVYTHDLGNYEAAPVSDRQLLITQLSTWLTGYGARQIFMDQLGDYFYARAKSTLVSGLSTSTDISLTFTGNSTDPDGNLVPTMALLFTGDNEGTWVNIPGFVNGTTVQIGNVQLVSISVAPSNATVPKGAIQQFTATGTYSDSSTADLTKFVSWTSNNTAVATINNSGLASAVATGTANIQATYESIAGSAAVTVTPPALVSLTITPVNAYLAVNGTMPYDATGTYTDGSTQDLTNSVVWTSSNPAIASITNTGLAKGVAVGTATIQATSSGVTGSTSLTITPTLVSITVTPLNGSIPKGTTQQFTATGTYSDGSQQNLTTSVSWISTNSGIASISLSGLATGVAAGATTIQASASGVSGSASLTVTAPTLSSILVTPQNSSVASGATVQFTATGVYTDGSQQNLTSSVTWTSGNVAVATISNSGLATGVTAGTVTIQAMQGVITGSTALTVTRAIPGLVAYWTFDQGSGTIASDSSGNGYNATLVNGVTWVSGKIGDAVSANGTNQYGSIPAINLSTTNAVTLTMWVNRTYSTGGGHTLFENSTNFNSSTTGFGIFPDDSTCKGIMVALQGNVGYSVNCYADPASGAWHHLAAVFDKSQAGNAQTALYVDGVLQTPKSNYLTSKNTNNFGSNPSYLLSRGGTQEYCSGIIDDMRLYNRALSASEIQQIYSFTGATLTAIAVTPSNPSVAKGSTQQFTASGTFSDGSQQNITNSVAWSSNNLGISTITSAGLATGVGVGSATIQATSGSISGSTTLTVIQPTLVSIGVTPTNASLGIGGTQQYTATGNYTDGSQQDLTGSVTWASSNTTAATISSAGLATGVSAGTTTVQATSGNVSGSTSLTVTKALVSIAVTPVNPSVPKGTTQQFTATGTYSDGSQQNLTTTVNWTSGNTSVASITSAGLATAVAIGTSTIQASSGLITGSTLITVTTPALVSISVSPANASLGVGSTQQFVATGNYSDGTQQNLTNSVIWTSTSPAVASITSTGLATGVGAGSTSIQATSGLIMGSTSLTVTKALISIEVTPLNPSIPKGTVQQFTATGTYSDGSQQNLTTTVSWSSTSMSVATITTSGMATGIATGNTTIQASSGTISGSTTLTVTPASLISIVVTPSNPSIGSGGTQQFTATGNYTDGSQQNLTSVVTWTSSNTAVATITSTGLATAVGTGNSNIQAASSSISGSSQLTVTSQIPGLVGYWKFDDGAGTTAVDSSGNAYNMTLSGGVTWVAGVLGDAISGNGTKQYGKTPAITLSSTSAVTVTLWVNRTYSITGGHTLFEDSTNFNNSTTGFGFYPDDNTCNGMMVGEHGNAGYNINCYAQPSSGAWHHLAAVYDKSQPATSEVTLYVDGVLQTPTQNYLASNNTNAFGNNALYVLSRGGSSEYTGGMVDDLRIYNRALSAAEIQQIFNTR